MKEEVEIDKFHWHEALDRTSIIMQNFNSNVIDHAVIEQHPELNALAERAIDALYDLYQAIINKTP